MKWNYPEGATPLDPDEVAGLIPAHITVHAELNEWEQENILEAELWITQHRQSYQTICEQDFIKQLHTKMFRETWRWAGKFRKTDKNIGIDWRMIPVRLQTVLDDIKHQIENKTYSFDEIAARFHHRVVFIHPFPNGNGRHARLLADALLLSLEQPRFTWGAKNLIQASQTRSQYIEALRAADRHKYEVLLDFARN